MKAKVVIKMTRLQYFLDNVDFTDILRKVETREFLELVVDRYGDVITYRVYGDKTNGFTLGVK